MTTIRLRTPRLWIDAPAASARHRGRGAPGSSKELLDALLRRTNRLLTDSAEALRRLRIHTEETERQVEASRAFLADSYHTLDVLRRDRDSGR